jgi:thiosulfate/3-mercaptopyruvate sulfurtransferase
VVVYDAMSATYAARAWWMLRWLGHQPVAVLDGGLQAWQAAGGELLSGNGPALVTDAPAYPLADATLPVVTAEGLMREPGRWAVVDARAPERFRGDVEPLDSRAGHIPGARNRFFRDNLDASGHFLPAETLRATFSAWGVAPGQMVHQCGSGVTACHNLLAMEAAGLTGASLYPGSWSEWSADPARPVALGG